MGEVAAMLTNIENAGKGPSPFNTESLAALEQLEGKISRNRSIQQKNQATRDRQVEIESQVKTHLLQWLENELRQAARAITDRGLTSADVQVVRTMPPIGLRWSPQAGVELILSEVSESSSWVQALQLYFCMEMKITSVVMIVGANADKSPAELKMEDRHFGVLPIYTRRTKAAEYGASGQAGFWVFGTTGQLIAVGPSSGNQAARLRQRQVGEQQECIMQTLKFSQWPDKQAETLNLLGLLYPRFLEVISRNLGSPWVK